MKSMVATKPFRYGRRDLVAGDPFECRLPHVRVLVAIGRAKVSPAKVAEAAPVPAKAEKTPRSASARPRRSSSRRASKTES